jgi:methionine sulfoxide reductase heme-binding subunit
MINLKAPWNERNGRFSALKAVVFAGLFVPAAWIVYLAATGALEPKVVTEMIHRTGQWAIRFLTLSLLITPLMRSTRTPKLVTVRRVVGVLALDRRDDPAPGAEVDGPSIRLSTGSPRSRSCIS